MGFFSWLTCDTNETLWNKYTGKSKPFYVLRPNMNSLYFVDYDGYGRFISETGEVTDAHVLIAQLNNVSDINKTLDELRDIGIKMHFNPELFNVTYFLKISFNPNTRYEDYPRSENCPNQGYFDWS